MCCRGKASRRGFGSGLRGGFASHCGPNRNSNFNTNTNPQVTFIERRGPRGLLGLIGFIAAKRAEKTATRQEYMSYQNVPETQQVYGYADQRAFQEQQRQQEGAWEWEWEDEKREFERVGMNENGNGNGNDQGGNREGGARFERVESLNATPPRYSAVMRE